MGSCFQLVLANPVLAGPISFFKIYFSDRFLVLFIVIIAYREMTLQITAVIAAMALVALGMVWYFKRKKWF
jgi:hypothetical protein